MTKILLTEHVYSPWFYVLKLKNTQFFFLSVLLLHLGLGSSPFSFLLPPQGLASPVGLSSSCTSMGKKCYCGSRALIGRSIMSSNSGRWFFGFHNWKTNDCGYFKWMEPKKDEVTSSQPTEWKQRGKESRELIVNKNLQDSPIDVLWRDIVEAKGRNKEIHTEIL